MGYDSESYASAVTRKHRMESCLMIAFAAALAVAIVLLVIWAWRDSQEQRRLIASGACEKVTEALYTPPPQYNTNRETGVTTVYQRDPYMRSLWRCRTDEGPREFWRRTVEEFQ